MAIPDPMSLELALEIKQEILAILDEILSLKGRSAGFSEKTPLLGAIPELDSMAVVAMITTLEERFGFVIEDDEIDGATFATLGSLVDFVQGKLAD
jgi:acyl carrier protein